MRFLIACDHCRRQYDAGRLRVGSRFHCRCGRVVTVPRPQAHDAAVVRCVSCGAVRREGETHCAYCRSEFTLHDQDLHTVCPTCMARVSDRARYCHACGTPIVPEGTAGEETGRPCPSCPGERHLNSRRLGEEALSVLECPQCAGLWLAPQGFELLLDRARRNALPEETAFIAPGRTARKSTGVRYVKCPVCSRMMNRRHFGRGSGAILDICKEHGVWFDAHELEQILSWVRRGGEETSKRKSREETKEEERVAAFLPGQKIPPTSFDPATVEASPATLFQDLIAGIFDG